MGSDVGEDRAVEAPVTVGGSALPGGVMMRTRTRVGVAVRREEDGEIVTEGFAVEPPTGRWTRWPLMRGVVAIHTALKTGQKSMSIGERLRWEELPKGETAAEELEEEQATARVLGEGRGRVRRRAGRGAPDRGVPDRAGRDRQGGGPGGRGVHHRGRGDPARAAARHAAGAEPVPPLPEDPQVPRRRAPGDRRVRGGAAPHRRGRRRVQQVPPAVRDVVPGGVGGRVDRDLRRRAGDHGRVHVRGPHRDPADRRAHRDRRGLRAAAPGGEACGRAPAVPVVARHVGAAAHHGPARRRRSSRWRARR